MGNRKALSKDVAETHGVLEAPPPRKKLHLACEVPAGEPLNSPHDRIDPPSSASSALSVTGTVAVMEVDASPSRSDPPPTYNASKRSQVVVGVNAVTRQLEKNGLRFGLVCLSAKPPLIHRHLLMLAATRGVPFAALPTLSETASPLLGVKSALAIGIKVCGRLILHSIHGPEGVYRDHCLSSPIYVCIYSRLCCACQYIYPGM